MIGKFLTAHQQAEKDAQKKSYFFRSFQYYIPERFMIPVNVGFLIYTEPGEARYSDD
jgi:hypothetical protein